MDAINADVPSTWILYVSSQQQSTGREKRIWNTKFDSQVSSPLLLSQLRGLQLRQYESECHIDWKFNREYEVEYYICID
jgi:hypothetical protein